MTSLREAAQAALEALKGYRRELNDQQPCDAEQALRAALAEPVEPVPWSNRERFYEALDRAVENVKQDMKVKTVTMRLTEYDIAMPIIDAYSGHVLVGPVPTPPQRKPLTEEEIWALYYALPSDDFERSDRIDFARAVEAAHGIK